MPNFQLILDAETRFAREQSARSDLLSTLSDHGLTPCIGDWLRRGAERAWLYSNPFELEPFKTNRAVAVLSEAQLCVIEHESRSVAANLVKASLLALGRVGSPFHDLPDELLEKVAGATLTEPTAAAAFERRLFYVCGDGLLFCKYLPVDHRLAVVTADGATTCLGSADIDSEALERAGAEYTAAAVFDSDEA